MANNTNIRNKKYRLSLLTPTMKRHLDLCVSFYGASKGALEFRKCYVWYTRGFSGTKPLRIGVFSAGSRLEMIRLIEPVAQTHN